MSDRMPTISDIRPIAPLDTMTQYGRIAMVGIIVGMTLFNTLKSYFMSQSRMRTFIVFGRTVQYAAVGVADEREVAVGGHGDVGRIRVKRVHVVQRELCRPASVHQRSIIFRSFSGSATARLWHSEKSSAR